MRTKAYCVIGMGSIAHRHIQNLRYLHPEAEIMAVSSSGKNVELPNGASTIASLNQALEHPLHYCIVASPAAFHTSIALAFLRAGVPVLVEKPLASDSVDGAKFCASSQFHQAPIARVGYCLRFLSTAAIVRQMLRSGSLGELYNVYSFVGQYLPLWRPNSDYRSSVSASKALGGGALLELSHELDLLNWFIDDLNVVYSCLREQMELNLEVEECADLILEAPTRCLVSLHMDFIQKSPVRRMEFFGEKGVIRWNLMSNKIKISINGISPKIIHGTERENGEMYIQMLRAFEAEIEGRPHPLVANLATVKEAQVVLEQIDKAKDIDAWKTAR